ncbi:MAG: DUF4126 domain-containing protein, partial [Rhizobiales bacterium]|nr:DUF4126 domain-containing protein [Hyphomicrobiales bacterium]
VMWLDSLWDTVHTLVRPSAARCWRWRLSIHPIRRRRSSPFCWARASFLAHGGKASARAVVNTSPEPVSNIVASSAEDVVTVGLLWVAYEYPVVAGGIAAVLLMLVTALLWWAKRVISRVFFRRPKAAG